MAYNSKFDWPDAVWNPVKGYCNLSFSGSTSTV